MTDKTPPAGYYPNQSGRKQWWDGNQWTEHYEDAAAPAAPASPAAPSTPRTMTTGEKKKRPWLIPTIVGVVALFIGVGIGSSGSTAEETPKVKSTTGLTVADLDDRENALEDQKAELDDKATDLDAREEKVNAAEKKAKADTIDGDGNYEVGNDIKAGKWKNADADDMCYWSINSDSNGSDIVANHNGGGPQTLTVRNGQYLELQDCGTWKKIG